eukprot:766691-Hanusia_phi.AAC.12
MSVEEINEELKGKYHLDLQDSRGREGSRHNTLQFLELVERLRRQQQIVEKANEEILNLTERCHTLEAQNLQLRSDLELALSEGMKYRDSLREWAELEERRISVGYYSGELLKDREGSSLLEHQARAQSDQREVEARHQRQLKEKEDEFHYENELLRRECEVQLARKVQEVSILQARCSEQSDVIESLRVSMSNMSDMSEHYARCVQELECSKEHISRLDHENLNLKSRLRGCERVGDELKEAEAVSASLREEIAVLKIQLEHKTDRDIEQQQQAVNLAVQQQQVLEALAEIMDEATVIFNDNCTTTSEFLRAKVQQHETRRLLSLNLSENVLAEVRGCQEMLTQALKHLEHQPLQQLPQVSAASKESLSAACPLLPSTVLELRLPPLSDRDVRCCRGGRGVWRKRTRSCRSSRLRGRTSRPIRR